MLHAHIVFRDHYGVETEVNHDFEDETKYVHLGNLGLLMIRDTDGHLYYYPLSDLKKSNIWEVEE